MSDGTTATVVLICLPTTLPNPVPARVEQCGRCQRSVWVAEVQIMPIPPGLPVENCCEPCVLNDAELMAELPPILVQQLRAKYKGLR